MGVRFPYGIVLKGQCGSTAHSSEDEGFTMCALLAYDMRQSRHVGSPVGYPVALALRCALSLC